MSATHLVHRGTDLVLDRPVAIKTVRPDCPDGPARRGLTRQQVCLAQVRHRCVPQLWDREELPDGRPALILEWLDPAVPTTCPGAGATRAVGRDSALVADLTGAVLAVHDRGWTHGGVSPANVLSGADGRHVLTGFSGARPTTGGPDSPRTPAEAVAADIDGLRITLLTLLLELHDRTPPGAPAHHTPGQWGALLAAAGRLTPGAGRPALEELHRVAASGSPLVHPHTVPRRPLC